MLLLPPRVPGRRWMPEEAISLASVHSERAVGRERQSRKEKTKETRRQHQPKQAARFVQPSMSSGWNRDFPAASPCDLGEVSSRSIFLQGSEMCISWAVVMRKCSINGRFPQRWREEKQAAVSVRVDSRSECRLRIIYSTVMNLFSEEMILPLIGSHSHN